MQERLPARWLRPFFDPYSVIERESADLLYHLLVLLAEREVPPTAVVEVLRMRHAK